ncbi:MAG: hypothetical protein CMJ19_01225 [Phycisphaeraceae bacterium]|nr:hypothetical protein [Phycisphaeraceae bacterium]
MIAQEPKSIQPQVNIFLKGNTSKDLVKLVEGPSATLNLYHPGWLQGDQHQAFLAVTGNDLTDQWQDFTFSFTPQDSGEIALALSGRIHKQRDGERAKIYTVYDNIQITGAELKNPDFEQTDDIGGFIAWHSRWGTQPLKTDLGESAKVWVGNELTQSIQVTANTTVTISFKARAFAPFVEEAVADKDDDKPTRRELEDAREGMFPPLWYPLASTTEGENLDKRWASVELVKDIKLDGDSDKNLKDITDDLQKRLDSGEKRVLIPNGTFRITRLVLPADVTLKGSENTKLIFASDKPEFETLVTLTGDNTTLSNLNIAITDDLLAKLHAKNEHNLMVGEGLKNIKIDHVKFALTDKQYIAQRLSRQRPGTRSLMGIRWTILLLSLCEDIEISNCHFKNFSLGVRTTHCSRVLCHDNVGINGQHNLLSFYHGSEYVKFYNNWFSHVKHPLVWDGGDCSPQNKRLVPNLPRDVYRNMLPGDKDYAIHMTGTYEVYCHNNYGEYGKTLVWGRKGRRIIVTANSSKYQYDMAIDAEGCEEVIVANNICTNSKAAGIGSFYHNDKTVITGNMVNIEDIGDEIYKGQFIRLHSSHGTQSGKTIISGNLFVSHLQEPRFIKVDQVRNVVISGNKFVNGGILTNPYGGGKITATSNTFINQLPNQPSLVIINKIIKELTFRNNTFINENKASATGDPAVVLNFEVTQKLAAERPDTIADDVFRQLDGNSFRGWATPIAFNNVGLSPYPARVILVNNLYEGSLVVPKNMNNVINQNNIQIGQ